MIDVRYFSGSGHCANIARVCAMALGTHAQPMKEGTRCEETLLFIFPVYGELVPPPAEKFLKNCRAKYAAFIAVYGGMSYGRALWDAQKRFARTLAQNGLARFDGETLALTPRGMLVQNAVLCELL